MKSVQKLSFLSIFSFTLILASCGGGSNNDNPTTFDRKAMLKDYATKTIVPAFVALDNEAQKLQTAVNGLVKTPTTATLNEAKTAWEKTYLAFLNANPFTFGPAGEEGVNKSLTEEIGTFPISETKIQNFIAANDTSFNNFDRDARGLLTVEMMLFKNSESQTLVDLGKPTHKNYLLALTNNIQKRTAQIRTAWSSYSASFSEKNGTDIGSSTAVLYNEFLKSYEQSKNFRLGLPLGKRVGQTKAEFAQVEAFYSGKSYVFLKNHFEAIVRLWEGTGLDGSNGIGFKEYLQNTEGGSALIGSTETQIAAIRTEFSKLDLSKKLSEHIEKTPSVPEPLYNEMQRMTRFFKSDMSSLLGIQITFASGDGD